MLLTHVQRPRENSERLFLPRPCLFSEEPVPGGDGSVIAQARNLQVFCLQAGACASEQLLAALALKSLRVLDVRIDARATLGLTAIVGKFRTIVELVLRLL
jgi:hypothetical protein